MPKSIVREFDNSNPGLSLTSNFSVALPGFMGEPEGLTDADIIEKAAKIDGDGTDKEKALLVLQNEAKAAGIYFELDKVYKLSSTAHFLRYIGEFGGEISAVAPELTVLNSEIAEDSVIINPIPAEPTNEEETSGEEEPSEEETPEEETTKDYVGINRYLKHLKVIEFHDIANKKFYLCDEVPSTEDDYGTYGYLLKTITYSDGTIKTYRFTEVSEGALWDDLPKSTEGEYIQGQTKKVYAIIEVGKEGVSAQEESDHMGNKIAYELLGLGYTVYFKVMDKSIATAVQLAKASFWEPFKNKSTYHIRYLLTGGCYDKDVAERVAAIAVFNNTVALEEADTYGNTNGRGDIIALLDINEDYEDADYSIKNATSRQDLLKAFGQAAKILPHNKYTAIFGPRVVYNGDSAKFPCSFHYLACAAQAQTKFAEWYAVAGYARGVSPKSIAYTTYDFGDIDINTLAPRKANTFTDTSVNLILNERGNYYLWGNRTSETLDSEGLVFSHFLNIRQLCCTLKQVLYEATRRFTFDPNSDLLWISFVNAIRPTLESMKTNQGIKGYRISKVATDKKAVLIAKIRIVPIEALEDFDISVYLEDSLSGINVTADEEVAE